MMTKYGHRKKFGFPSLCDKKIIFFYSKLEKA